MKVGEVESGSPVRASASGCWWGTDGIGQEQLVASNKLAIADLCHVRKRGCGKPSLWGAWVCVVVPCYQVLTESDYGHGEPPRQR
jgi:hypothetical protein